MITLSVIVPTKDRGLVLHRTLSALSESLWGLESEVVVVNDGKDPLTPLMQSFPEFHFIKNPGRGVASARNFGVTKASGSLLLFLDDDILVSAQSVRHVIALHEEHRKACFNLNWEYTEELNGKLQETLFGRFLQYHRMTSFRGWYNDENSWRENELFESKSVASFHLSIERNCFLKSGGYNEGFPFAGFEDYDFPLRLRAAGVRFFIDTRVTVYHNEMDRLNMTNWLNSQEQRAVTRRFAVGQGYDELTLSYNPVKRAIFQSILRTESAIRKALTAFDRILFFDWLGRRIIALMQASRIFKGYCSN